MIVVSAACFVCDTPAKISLSSLLLCPVYVLSSLGLFLLLLTPLCFSRRGEKLCFVLRGSRSGKREGEACVLICRPAVMLWVWRGLKHITKLICPLHRQPCSTIPCTTSLPPSSPLSLFHCLLSESRGEATKHRSSEISSVCRPLISLTSRALRCQVMIKNN